MDKKIQTCCFSGHRNLPQGNELEPLKRRLRAAIVQHVEKGVRYFGSGGAVGFDMLAAHEVLELKREYPDIHLILVLPCPHQDKFWRKRQKAFLDDLIVKSDKTVYVSAFFFQGCMQARNRHLVEHSAYMIAYCEKPSGGTAQTIALAQEDGLEITFL